MSEEYQSPYVSSSVLLDDILQESTPEGAETAGDDLPPLKPGAGDAPVSTPAPPRPVPAPRAFETVESNDVTRGAFQDDSPPPLPAISRPEPESVPDTELAKRRPQLMDFVNLKDQPSSGEPVGPQDAAPVHVEPVPVFSMPSFSSDSITELITTAKTVHTDLVQPEVPVNKILPSISSFVEKQRTDHLEKVHSFEKVHVKPAIRKSSELDALISVDECSFQCNEHQCAESNESELGRTTSSLVEETMSKQDTADKEGLLKISQNASIGKVQLSNEREVELGPHLSLCEYVADPKMNASPLTTIGQENKSMCDILDFKEQTLKSDSGLNFCYGDSLEMKERNGLNSCTTCHDDAIKSIVNLTVKSESAMFPGQEVLDMPCDSKKQIVAEGNENQDHAGVESFVGQLFEQGGKQSPNDAYFAFSQVPVKGEPQACMTYATFDSSMACPQSGQISNEMISAYKPDDAEKTELEETSKLPLLLTIHESEVTKNVEDEVKCIPLMNSGKEHVSKVNTLNSQLFGSFAVEPDLVIKTDSLAEDISSEQTVQNSALHQSERIFQIELAVSVEKDSSGLEMSESTSDLLNSFEPLQSTLEQHAVSISEEEHSLIDVTVKAPSVTDIEGIKMIADPDNVKVQFDFQNESKEQTVYASIHETANGTAKVAKRPHLFEEQKTVSNRVEDPFVNLESIPISQDSNLTQQLLVDSNKESVIKDEDLYKYSWYQETDVSKNTSQSVDEPSKHELMSSKSEEEKCCLTSLAPTKVLIDTSVTVKRQDMALSNEITSSKSEPVTNMRVLGDTIVGMKPSKKILTDYKYVEQCSPRMPSVQDPTETPMLVKRITEDDLASPVKVTDKATEEIMLSHQEASGELLPFSSTSENYAVEECVHSLIEDFNASTPPSVLSEDLSTMGKRLPLQISEETCLNISKSFTSPVTPSQDKFLEYSENVNEMTFKADGNSEILDHTQIQIMPRALPIGVSFPLNEEVTKASKEVVTKILETSVALAEVLGEKEGTRAMCVSQQETPITSVVGEDDVRKKNIPVESLVPELTVAKSTETSKDSAVADISVKQDKNSVVDLIYWRDIKKTGLVFGASLFLLLSMTIFSIVSVIAYLGLAVLSVTISFRIYRGILQAVQKSDDGHPFKACLEKDVAVPDELVHKYSDIGLGHINHMITELRRLFLVQDLVDSIKFSVLMWLLTYVGALFNGLTLLIIALVAVFSIPVVYERHQGQIDHYMAIASKQIKEVTAKIQARVPGLKKKTE